MPDDPASRTPHLRWLFRPPLAKADLLRALQWYLGQFVVVVTSILCAFAIGNWAEGRADRRTEASYLSALEADFEASRGDLAEVITGAEASIARTERLLRYTALGPDQVQTDSALAAVGTFRGFNTFAPTTGAYDNLILSGDLGLIQSDSLREALAAWGGMLARNRVLEGVMVDQYHSHTEFMRRRVASRAVNPSQYPSGLPPSRHGIDVRSLLNDMEFENLVRERYGAASEALEYNLRLARHIEEVLRLIGEAQGRS